MADGRSAEEAAATDLCDDSRVPRERHKKRVVEHYSTLPVIRRNNDQKRLYHTTQRSNNSVISASGCRANDNVNNNNKRSEIKRCVEAIDVYDGDFNVVDDDEEDEEEDDEDEEEDHNVINHENKLNILKNVVLTNNTTTSVNIKTNALLPVVQSSLSSSSSSLHCGEEKLIDNIECTRNIILDRCMENCSDEIVMLMEYSGSNKTGIIDGNIMGNDTIITTTNKMDTVQVVDAAAAAVAVSAIPETMKEIHQHKQQQGGDVVARLTSPFKGQIRMAEDTLVGPCGKKRCADRYDSSESSDR
ncbi:hypothetical protein PV326_005731 [Microctonus aethiopoides]|nr:hypothetical protein PV326_005731 [Microctonus aethiopoides]